MGEQTWGCLTHRLALRRSGCRRVSTSANEVTVVTVGNAEGASIEAEPAGSIDFGLISPAIENPPAIRTLMAVAAEAGRLVTDWEESGVIGKISQALNIAPLDGIS